MAFRPLEEVLGPIVLPIGDKEYTLPTVGLADALRLRSILNGEAEDAKWSDLFDILLGDVYPQLKADRIGTATSDRVFFTALADAQQGREAAEKVWENGIPPEWLALLHKAVEQAQATAEIEPTGGN